MGLKPFEGTEIRFVVMGMEITLTAETIGEGTDYPSLDHKIVLYCLATFQRINLPKYILHHMCWALRENQRNGRRQIPFGRLLSKIFVQGKLLKYLKESGVSSDEELGTVVGKIISGKTLKSMKLIENLISSEEDLTVETQYIKAHFQLTAEIISVASIPDKIGGAPLKVKGKRSKNAEKDDVIQKKRNKEPHVQDAAREVVLREEVARREAVIREEAVRERSSPFSFSL
ncbi:hypothetical protein MTR_3g047110 [Medicago truncatula]|uniref:Uncharacterized protein n=1 Tax=Medicago truncatula TaxID=3880 RepID=G7IXH1_MEDTR|nr:hypothetical protein MTR_3g047110 [Medicago truncatula]